MATQYGLPQISPQKIRSYFLRLPIFTRAMMVIIVACYVASWFTPIQDYAALKPDLIGLSSLGRISSYPFVHDGFFHFVLNLVALTPLLERFEAENGTLVSLLLFFGPFCTLPGIVYVVIEHIILRGDTAVMGASIWVFLLLASEAIKTYRSNPYFTLSTYRIPTWTTPVLLMLAISFLVPRSSLIGHLCGAAIGYLWGLGLLKFLVPPEKLTRWLEEKLQLLQRVPHYVSVDQKTYGRYGVLPSVSGGGGERRENGTPMSTFLNQPPQRLGP